MTYEKTLTESELKYGRLKIPVHLRQIFPPFNSDVRSNEIILSASGKEWELKYDNDEHQILWISKLYKELNLHSGDTIHFRVLVPFQKYEISK